MQKVQFISTDSSLKFAYEKPKPASNFVPGWYKATPKRIPGEIKDGIAASGTSSNQTIKACVPFLDVMTSGYIFTSPCDVEVSLYNNEFQIRWLVDYNPISTHSEAQLGDLPRSSDHDTIAFKWDMPWMMKTPPGYSTFFTHPVNRYDLPFRTMGGIVETDTYNLATNFPFQVVDIPEDKYIIPQGTPIVQAIPFKRESWQSEYLKADDEEYKRNLNSLKGKILRSYKTTFWKKKEYN
jgi:hypothetical protein